ncbi:MAG TPA: NlpC/P60 family protein [Terriglobales bacterium]|nr:NlpC/P60 family protein [Terriglobales bacterium]
MKKRHKSAAVFAAAVFGISTLGLAAQKPNQSLSSNAESTEAQSDSSTADSNRETNQRLLSRREGLELINMAIALPAPSDDQPDCSHLVHQIFAAAGYDYPYATSYDLYAGVPSFQRVQNPQTGDLVVWRGHVGVMVDPSEHSFYSSTDSGLVTQQYDNDYWRQRGRPRFYRYLIGASTSTTPVSLPKSGHSSTTRISDMNGAGEQPADASPLSKIAGEPHGAAIRNSADKVDTSFQMPEDIAIPDSDAQSDAKPTASNVSEAISELTTRSSGVLRNGDLASLSAPVVIFDQLQVEKVEIHHDKSWANVRIDYRVELNQGQVKSQHHSDKRRWELQKTEDGWVAVTPQDRIYVPAEKAAQIVSERLYKLTRKSSDKNRSQQANLARLLDAVYN